MIIRTYQLRCDYCDAVYDNSAGQTESGTNQRTEAAKAGWITLRRPGGNYGYRRSALDVCSDCAPKRAAS